MYLALPALSLTERAKSVEDRVVSKHSGTVVLVSHRVVNKVLICSMLGLDNSHFGDIKQDVWESLFSSMRAAVTNSSSATIHPTSAKFSGTRPMISERNLLSSHWTLLLRRD